jgi:hypothetical protein
MSRVTAKMLDRNCAILCRLLDCPDAPYVNGIVQPGCIYVSNAGYGYGIEQIVDEKGCIQVHASGMSAAECYQWLQGAFMACRVTGHDGPIAERWNGRGLLSGSRVCAAVKFCGPTDTKPARWKATIEDISCFSSFTDGPIQAAIKVAEKRELSNIRPRHALQVSPDFYVIEF